MALLISKIVYFAASSSHWAENIQTEIRKNYTKLKNIMRPDNILDEMFAESCLDMEEHTEVTKKSVSEKNYTILKKVIRDTNFVENFMERLQQTGQGQLVHAFMVKRSVSEVYLSRITYCREYADVY